MKKLSLCLATLLIASNAMAQAVIPNVAEPAASTPAVPAPPPAPPVPSPSAAPAVPVPGNSFSPPVKTTAPTINQPAAPTAPSVAPVSMAPSGMTSAQAEPASTLLQTAPAEPAAAAPAQSMNLNDLVGKLAGNKNSSQKLGQVMVIGSIMGCTQKAAGKPATDAFQQQMQGVTKTVEGYCKSGNATQARATVLDTLNQKHNDPVALAALNCYNAQKSSVASMGGQQVAADAEHYARWLKDPATAKAEMQESDVCRNSKKQ